MLRARRAIALSPTIDRSQSIAVTRVECDIQGLVTRFLIEMTRNELRVCEHAMFAFLLTGGRSPRHAYVMASLAQG